MRANGQQRNSQSLTHSAQLSPITHRAKRATRERQGSLNSKAFGHYLVGAPAAVRKIASTRRLPAPTTFVSTRSCSRHATLSVGLG